METSLSPLDFARRARRLYADREAVVDGCQRASLNGSFLTVVIEALPRCKSSA